MRVSEVIFQRGKKKIKLYFRKLHCLHEHVGYSYFLSVLFYFYNPKAVNLGGSLYTRFLVSLPLPQRRYRSPDLYFKSTVRRERTRTASRMQHNFRSAANETMQCDYLIKISRISHATFCDYRIRQQWKLQMSNMDMLMYVGNSIKQRETKLLRSPFPRHTHHTHARVMMEMAI